MNRVDPFYGYSLLLRAIVYVLVPAFGVLQFFRLRRALHVFQLEGYKRSRFLRWCRAHPRRARFLAEPPVKKPLVMTGRAVRILGVATALSELGVLLPAGAAHLFAGGWPADVLTWCAATIAVVAATPRVLVAADWLLSPLQRLINGRYLRAARRVLQDVRPLVIGVTGSFGKTSTKFAVAGALGAPDEVLATPGSYNTPLGVCRAINERLGPTHRAFVVEMGAYVRGDIAELCRFVEPRIAVLTSIGPAHLERFGSMEAIASAKYEIVESLPPDGVAVMNVDDEIVRVLADATTRVRVVRYGLDAVGAPDITARSVRAEPSGSSFSIHDLREETSVTVSTRLLGRHAIGHVLAAVAVAREAGRPLRELVTPIEKLRPVEHRLQIIEGTGGITVIDDAYNSNPEGAADALDVLHAIPARQKVVVSPGIVELGSLQVEANERFGEHAARVADVVVVVAAVNREAIAAGAARANGSVDIVEVDSLDEARQRLARLLRPGAVVLFENDLPDQYEG